MNFMKKTLVNLASCKNNNGYSSKKGNRQLWLAVSLCIEVKIALYQSFTVIESFIKKHLTVFIHI